MSPEPLHPAVVHFPIVLVFLVPISALVALWAIRRGAKPIRAWAIPVALAAALAGSSFAAVRTGEADEERVEEVVPERAVHEHEEAGEQFLVFAAILLVVTAVGLLRSKLGAVARIVALAGSLVLVVDVVRVGSTGGELVYRLGAARAYSEAPAAAELPTQRSTEREEED